MSDEKFEQTMDKGRALLEKKDFNGAEKVFRQALKMHKRSDNIPAINNLALSIYASGDLRRALETLEKYLKSDPPFGNPFTFGFAAQLKARLGDIAGATSCLDRAIHIFEAAIPLLDDLNYTRESWYEYTVQIMLAAGIIGDHRRVLELFRRHEKYHVSWQNRYMAGIAAFNLGRFKQAASIWQRINEFGNFSVPYQQVAFSIERGTIPPFTLDYEPFNIDRIQDMFLEAEGNDEIMEKVASRGDVRIMLLFSLYDERTQKQNVKQSLQMLIRRGGEWGKDLGLRILESSEFEQDLKSCAATALVERGVFNTGEEIPVIINGKEQVIIIKTGQISDQEDPVLDKLDEEAIALRDEGKVDEAITLLEKQYNEVNFYPRIMITLGNLYRQKRQFDRALNIFEILGSVMPDNPVIQINLGGVYLQTGAYEQALGCIEHLDEIELDDYMREKVEIIREKAEYGLLIDDPEGLFLLDKKFDDEFREEIETKKISTTTNLIRGLKNMPNEWLLNICDLYKLKHGRLRRDREAKIVAYLTDSPNLKAIVEQLTNEERDLLRYLLQKGGFARLNAVTRKFGTLEGDGYYWYDYEPDSVTGKLWSKALIFIGRIIIDNRNTKIAVIPLELRSLLEKALR